MTHVAKFLGLSAVGSGIVMAGLLLISISVDNPPEKEKPVVKGKIEDPKKKEEDLKKKLEEELRKKLEEEKKKAEEELKHKQIEETLKELDEERRKTEVERRKLEEERRKVEAEKASAPKPPTPEEMRRMIEEALKQLPQPSPPQPEKPAAPPPDLPKAEPAPEIPQADIENPPSKRKGGFFIYVDSAPLDTLRRSGFVLAVADSEGFVTHVVGLDAGNRVTGYKEFDRDDRSVYGDVMFRLRDARKMQGVAAIDRSVSEAFEGSSLKLLILRATYNKGIAPLILQGQKFAERYKLDFDGIRISLGDEPAWEGVYSRGKFYRKP